jgi:hypothetical protein
LGVEEVGAQPARKKTGHRRYLESLLGFPNTESSVDTSVYQTTLLTSVLEYFIIIFFGLWLMVEYFYNIYEQQYFGSYDPIFLIIVLMVASAYGFHRLIAAVRVQFVPLKKRMLAEDDY